MAQERNNMTNYVQFEDSYNMVTSNQDRTNIQTLHNVPQNIDEIESPGSKPVYIHHVTSDNKRTWNHIEDLDIFFRRIYLYFQQKGMLSIILQNLSDLIVFGFTCAFVVFVLTCINYNVVFHQVITEHDDNPNDNITTFTIDKKTISDCILSSEEIMKGFPGWLVVALVFATIFWVIWFIHFTINMLQFWNIKLFFNEALGIPDGDLLNWTWEEIQNRILEVQHTHQMCIHNLTELDIYHRILRFDNYFIAMVNRGHIPLKIQVPIFGEIVFLTRGLRNAIDFILFWGPWAVFKNNWHIKEEFRDNEKRAELAKLLDSKIFTVGVVLLVFSPFLLFYQVLYTLFQYAEILKKEPGIFGMRRWSHYAETYCRHYNELDHELKTRLSRAYDPANKYINSFTYPLVTELVKPLTFIFGAILVLIAGLAMYDTSVLEVEHILLVVTISGGVVAICRSLTPGENIAWRPEPLMKHILSHLHYLPDDWKGKAHSTVVRNGFSKLFQYKASHVIEETISCIVTPLYLIYFLRHRALDIVDFFRNFTVDVTGVGHVCSFAMMDVKKHGNPHYHPTYSQSLEELDLTLSQNDYGRTERSLVHFKLTNPRWQPPRESINYLTAVRECAEREFPVDNDCTSLLSLAGFPLERVDAINYGARSNVLLSGLGAISSSNTGNLHNTQSNHPSVSHIAPENNSNLFDPSSMAPSNYSANLNMDDALTNQMKLSMVYLYNLNANNKSNANYTDQVTNDNTPGIGGYQNMPSQPSTSRSSFLSTTVGFSRSEESPLLGNNC